MARSPGEGTVYEQSKGRWIGYLSLPPHPDGRRRRKKFTGATRKAVVAKMDEARKDLALGVVVDRRISVKDYLTDWLKRRKAAGDLATSTLTTYTDIVDIYIEPRIGHRRLADLSVADVEHLTSDIIAAGKSPRTAAAARAVLRRALTDAEREGVIGRNVARLARPPRQERRPVDVLQLDEARALLDHVADHRLSAAFVLTLTVGLRSGELRGLQWGDVDLDRRRLTVRHQLQNVDGQDVLVDTKTVGSARSIPLPDLAVTALTEHRRLHPGLPSALVFTSSTGTPIGSRNWRRDVYDATEAAIGRKVPPHQLRHAAASFALHAGASLKQVAEMLGHSSIRVTADTYGHLLADDRATADAIDRALAR